MCVEDRLNIQTVTDAAAMDIHPFSVVCTRFEKSPYFHVMKWNEISKPKRPPWNICAAGCWLLAAFCRWCALRCPLLPISGIVFIVFAQEITNKTTRHRRSVARCVFTRCLCCHLILSRWPWTRCADETITLRFALHGYAAMVASSLYYYFFLFPSFVSSLFTLYTQSYLFM